MATRRNAQISSRKQPKQARSTELVAVILEAAIQVLAKEGAQRFTTARVAERAGVSVGSVYQYFPNKAAILFRLQSDEWRQTSGTLRDILADAKKSPFERLRMWVHAFLRSECEEATMRAALDESAPLYRRAPEAREARTSSHHAVEVFLREMLPAVDDAPRAVASDLVVTTLSKVGKTFSKRPRTPAEIETYADAMADMFCAYLRDLDASSINQGERKDLDMKKSEPATDKSPSQLIDARIEELGDWRGETLGRLRAVIKAADPDIVEEWKWDVPVWSRDGIICTGEVYKSAVKMTFPKGATLKDPSGLFNSSLEGNARRAIDVREGDKINEKALTTLIRAAVTLNSSTAKAKAKPKTTKR